MSDVPILAALKIFAPHCHRERQSRYLLPLAISTHSMRARPRLGLLSYAFLALFFHPLDFRHANEDAPELLEDRKTSTCTRVEYFRNAYVTPAKCHSRLKDTTRLIGYANENMAEFVRGMRSEVSCNCDTAAAWKGGSENGKKREV